MCLAGLLAARLISHFLNRGYMNNVIALVLTCFFALTGCATFDKLVGVADTTISIPTARDELESYLTPGELVTIADDLALLDRTYQPIADAVFGQSDISVEDALRKAFDTVLKQSQLESAYKAIRQVVRGHRDASTIDGLVNDPIPPNLARVSAEIEQLWGDWESVIASNQRAIMYLQLAAKIALPV